MAGDARPASWSCRWTRARYRPRRPRRSHSPWPGYHRRRTPRPDDARRCRLMGRALAALERGSLTFTPRRPANGVTYAKEDRKAEARIDWTGRPTGLTSFAACRPFSGAWFEGPSAAPPSASRPCARRVSPARGGARHACSRPHHRLRHRRRPPLRQREGVRHGRRHLPPRRWRVARHLTVPPPPSAGGIKRRCGCPLPLWIPAFAGMTPVKGANRAPL